MNNEMTLNAPKRRLSQLLSLPLSLLKWLSTYYSQVLERPVSIRQTLHLLHVQTAAFLAIFPLGCSVLFRFLCILWLISALLKCRSALQNIC